MLRQQTLLSGMKRAIEDFLFSVYHAVTTSNVAVGSDLRLSKIRDRTLLMQRSMVRTSLEHLGPVEVGLLARGRVAVHGHAILTGRHVVAVHVLAVHGANIAPIGLRATHDGSHVSSVAISVIHAAHAAGARKMVLVTRHAIHAILNGNHAERMDHAIAGHAVHLVHVAAFRHTRSLLRLGVLLNVSVRVGEMAGSGGVATADGALLEVTLQDVTSRERIAAKNAHVRAVASVLIARVSMCAGTTKETL